VWQKRPYSPSEKERRLKVENDIVKQQIKHVLFSLLRKAASSAEITFAAGLAPSPMTNWAPINSTTPKLRERS
jgi:hypothetical protein